MTDDRKPAESAEKRSEHHESADKPLKNAPIMKNNDNDRQHDVRQRDAFRSFKLTAENPQTGDRQASFTIDFGNGKEVKDSRSLRADGNVKSQPTAQFAPGDHTGRAPEASRQTSQGEAPRDVSQSRAGDAAIVKDHERVGREE